MSSFAECARNMLAHGRFVSKIGTGRTRTFVRKISSRVKNALTNPPTKAGSARKKVGLEYVRALVKEKHQKRFPGDQGWLDDQRLHPLINHIVKQWDDSPPNKRFRHDRPEESFIHEFRVLHRAFNAAWIPAEERVISALVAGGHDFFEKMRENSDNKSGRLSQIFKNILYGSLNEKLPFLSVAEQFWPEPRDHVVIAQAWALLTDPTGLAGKHRIAHQQQVAKSADPDQLAHRLYARAKLLDKVDNFMSWRQDIFTERLKLTLKSASALIERTEDNLVVIKHLGTVLPEEPINHALLHGKKLVKLAGRRSGAPLRSSIANPPQPPFIPSVKG